MTNYITSVGVQQFSITISSGSTNGTATITAVGSGAFIVYGGINPSVSNSNSNEAFAYLTKTNSTTITATRNTGTAGTVVITGSIIDGDPTNLIKSVQYGTISIGAASSSGTASISAVTNANTAIHFLGDAYASAAGYDPTATPILTLSGTTVTATRSAITGNADTVGFVAIEFQGSVLNSSVQNIAASHAQNVTSYTASVSSVTANNTISIYAGQSASINLTNNAQTLQYGTLTNGTTFTVNINTSAGQAGSTYKYNLSIVEFKAGVLNSSVQRGTTTLTAATSNTSTITSVTAANSGIVWLGDTTSDTGTNFNQDLGAVVLTNGTTVTVQKNSATSNITGSWEVLEFPAFSGGVIIAWIT